jgi:signal peptidase I
MSDNKNEIFKITGAPVEKEVKQSEETDVEKTSAEETGSTENEASESKPVSHKRRLEKGSTAYEILDWFRTICIGVLAGIFIVVFLVQRDNVYGDSMKPTLSSGDVIYAQKISTYFHSYKRGDIVILDGHDMEGYYSKEYLVKRIVGLPGETVKIEDGNVYIKPADSSEFYLLQENYLPEGTMTTMMDDAMKKGNEIVLGDNEYYCLGDNRPVSNDSRNLGPFTADRIKGVAIIRVFPLNEIKIL